MRKAFVILAAVAAVSAVMPVSGAMTVLGVRVHVLTDQESWESGPTTMDDSSRFSTLGSTIKLETVTDTFETTLSVGPCTVGVTTNGQGQVTLQCTVPAQRVEFANEATQWTGGGVLPSKTYVFAAIAGYNEVFQASPNDYVVYEHVVRMQGIPQPLRAVTETKFIGEFFRDAADPVSYDCPHVIDFWLNATVYSDNHKFNSGPKRSSC